MEIAVLGAGSWGTALTILLARNGHRVTLMGRSREEMGALRDQRENAHYLPGFPIPESVRFETMEHDLGRAEMTVLAVPTGAVRQVVAEVRGEHPLVVIASKGLEKGTGKTMSAVVSEAKPEAWTAVLSGPNLAVEIARGIPTAAVAASMEPEAAERVREAFACRSFYVHPSDDLVGVELGGALKNALAIGAGMSDGLGFGDNTKGALLARGLHEMGKIGVACGARIETFLGFAGAGDLIATAVSRLSRNYRVGRALGEGRRLEEALAEVGQVAEGVPTSAAAVGLARHHDLQAPVFEAIETVIQGRLSPQAALQGLMERAPRPDFVMPR